MNSEAYTTRLQKGGALIDDMRAIVRNWTEEIAKGNQFDRFISDNILGKNTKTRSSDTFRRAFTHRFLEGNPPNAWEIARPLEDTDADIEVIRPVYYWITARSDRLLYDFIIDELYSRSKGHNLNIQIDETAFWISENLKAMQQTWTPTVTLKVSRGLLAALRDFGILEGANKKRIAPAYLPLESFAYIAFCLHHLGVSGERMVMHEDWKLFLFSPAVIERMFLEAHQMGYLRYEAAGNIYRIEFSAANYKEMADAIA